MRGARRGARGFGLEIDDVWSDAASCCRDLPRGMPPASNLNLNLVLSVLLGDDIGACVHVQGRTLDV
eukprot:SAG31_NODE_1597_length_7799_cov_37.912857_5_plen_67_part_00